MKTYILSLVLVVIALSFSVSAEAGLTGDTINWQYYVNGGTYNLGGSPGSFVADNTTSTFSFDSSPYFVISANDSQIIFDYVVTSTEDWISSDPSYNTGGLYIENGILLTGGLHPFSNVSIDASTNMAGFTPSNVTFNSSHLAINWAGLFFDGNTQVVLSAVHINQVRKGGSP